MERLGGESRYETAAEGAAQFGSSSVDYVATITAYPDALAGAGLNDAPVLLTRKVSLSSATRFALRGLNPDRIIVVGVTLAVTSGVARDLKGHGPGAACSG